VTAAKFSRVFDAFAATGGDFGAFPEKNFFTLPPHTRDPATEPLPLRMQYLTPTMRALRFFVTMVEG
jgi:hypothetical protein